MVIRTISAALAAIISFSTMLTVPAAQAADGTLRVAIAVLPPQLGNPFSAVALPTITTTSAMFDGLTRIAPDGTLKPWLAVSWTNVDAKTWRFKLREGVSFSNGRPFNAAAVAATVNYLAGTPRPTDNIVRALPPFEAARTVDEYTVEIVTKTPSPSMPRYAAVLLIPEPEAFATLGTEAFGKAPVGTGPFALQAWLPGKAVFKAFTGSWRKPKVAAMEILSLQEPTSRVQAILSDRADVATGLGPDDIQLLEAAGHAGVSWRDGGVTGISLVTTRDLPFNDVRVRRAINHAVDRQPIIDVLLGGYTVIANQPAGRAVLGHDSNLPLFDYDPAKAKALLAEAGYPNGFKFTMETSITTGSSLASFQRVAADLAKVGVMMEIRPVQGAQYLKNVFITGEYADAVVIPWQPTPTIDVLRAIDVHSCAWAHPWYCDRDAMPLIAAAEAEWDDAVGLDLRRALNRRYHDQAAALFLYEQVYFAGQRKGVTGFADHFGFVMYDEIALSR